MSFSENLKQIRKEHHLSQEELAELLDVSRQAVSKWEQGMGYPEVEKLLLLSHKLNISLDALMSTENVSDSGLNDVHVTGSIVITSPHENVIVTCYKVSAYQAKNVVGSPQKEEPPLLTPNKAYWGEFLPPFIFLDADTL